MFIIHNMLGEMYPKENKKFILLVCSKGKINIATREETNAEQGTNCMLTTMMYIMISCYLYLTHSNKTDRMERSI